MENERKVVIDISKLVKKYAKADVNAVDSIDLKIYEGEFFCLLGVNGAGKSTTINMLCTLLKPTSGEVNILGDNLGKGDNSIKQNIGVLFQGNVLDSLLTVEENLISRGLFYKLDKNEIKQKVAKLAVDLGMTEFINKRYGKLSGGQKRKADIARALLTSPKILFLDEPTTGLDPQSRIELWHLIKELKEKEKLTIILTTHYMEETESSDRVAIIDAGKIVCVDTPQMLKSKFSSDVLKLVVNSGFEKKIEKLLPNFKVVADTYEVMIKNNKDAIDILEKVKEYIHSFEMKKGDMDSVFVNIVGRK